MYNSYKLNIMFKTLGLFFLGLSISLQGVALFNDQWVQEDYERAIRETGRLANQLLFMVDPMIFFQHGLGIMLIISGFTIMNEMKTASTFAFLVVFLHSLVHYNPILYSSPRLGKCRVVNGVFYTVILLAGIKFLSFNQRSVEQKGKKQQVKSVSVEDKQKTD